MDLDANNNSTRFLLRGETPFYIVLLAFLLLYIFLGSFGYGNDNDTYGMLKTWSDIFKYHIYSPSRPPGYIIPEIVIGISAQLGQWIFSNIFSSLLACGSLVLFSRLLRIYLSPTLALLAVACVGLNPYFIIAASSSMDYIYAIFFFFYGLNNLLSKRSIAAGILFALCAASRLTYLPIILISYAACAILQPEINQYRNTNLFQQAKSLVWFIVSTIILYLPAWFSMGAGMFSPSISDKPVSIIGFDGFPNFTGYVIRFLYKNVSLWGIVAFGIVTFALSSTWIFRRRTIIGKDKLFWFLIAGFLYSELLFFRLPLEISYLLPVLFILIYMVSQIKGAKIFLALILMGQIQQSMVNLDFIEKVYSRNSYASKEASGARFHLHFSPGIVLQDMADRKSSQAYYFDNILTGSIFSK